MVSLLFFALFINLSSPWLKETGRSPDAFQESRQSCSFVYFSSEHFFCLASLAREAEGEFAQATVWVRLVVR